MNVLAVKPQSVENSAQVARYFEDFERLGFTTACISCCALPHGQLAGHYRDVYTGFAVEAIQRGYIPCVRIHSTLSVGDKIGISESQRDADDNPLSQADGFFASLASDAWRTHLKELVDIFVTQYGYQGVLFEGCEFRTDIPGPSDPFATQFSSKFPAINYPSQRSETPEYLKMRQEKSRVTMDFCSELAAHAKSVGAKYVGIVPNCLIPTDQGSADATAECGSESALLAHIPDVDFVVSSLDPKDVIEAGLRTGDEMGRSPAMLYTEVLAHTSSKQTVALSSPVGADKARDCINAALAAAPCGFVLDWEHATGAGEDYLKALAHAVDAAGRLGGPKASLAFVFSYSGTRHAEPYAYDAVFQAYWAIARQLTFKEHMPMLTFHAETLEEDLASHPEVQVLIFDERFPLSVEQMMVIRKWWQGTHRRAAVAFGVGRGFSADTDVPGAQNTGVAYPGMLELIGLRHDEGLDIPLDQPVALKDVSRVRRSAFLGEDLPETITSVAAVKRVFGSRANVLYEGEFDGNRIPVVAEWRDRTTLAVFCGFGLSVQTAEMATKAIHYILREVDAPLPIIDSCSDGVLWGINHNDYIVLSNLSDAPGFAGGKPGRANLWDCSEQRLLPDGDMQISLEPHSFREFRVVGRRSKFYDIIGCACLRSLVDGAGRAEIDIIAGKTTTFVLRSSPKEIYVDGRPSIVTQKLVDGAYYVTLQQCPPGNRKISLRW